MHDHVSQVAGSPGELSGERLHYGGGNFGADLLGGYIGSTGTASTYLAYPSGSSSGLGGNLSGMSAITQVILHIAVFWIVSIGVLILLHKAGFRFSLTVG